MKEMGWEKLNEKCDWRHDTDQPKIKEIEWKSYAKCNTVKTFLIKQLKVESE
jgi:hypothetical protein